jgi:ATP-binding cassette subfamily C protein
MNLPISGIKHSISLLSAKDKRKFSAVVLAQSFLGFFDLFGVVLIGAIGALAVRGVQSQPPGASVNMILNLFKIENQSLQFQISIVGGVAIALFVLKTIVSIYLSRRILLFLASKTNVIADKLTARILSAPEYLLHRSKPAEIHQALGYGVIAISLGVLGTLSVVISDSFLLLIIFIAMIILDPYIALVSFLFFSLVSLILTKFLSERSRSIGEQISQFHVSSGNAIDETIRTFREIYVRNEESSFGSRISAAQSKFSTAWASQIFLPNISKYVFELTLIVGTFVVGALAFATRDVSHAVAGLAVFAISSSRLAPALLRIHQGLIQIQGNLGSGSSTLRIWNETFNFSQDTDSPELSAIKQQSKNVAVSMERVDFTFATSSESILKNINLEINEGESVAFVGPSGAGKSTLVDLMLGILKPTSGMVTIGGMSPKEAIKHNPGSIGYVPQSVGLLGATLRENLAFGLKKMNLGDDCLLEVLEKVNLLDFVKTLEFGLDTKLGSTGVGMSAGQLQRIGIARALTSNPRILVMDEATSSLDGQNERSISDAISNLKGELTLVTIAHRLSTIRLVDRVFYLDKGEIKAIGTFDEVRKAIPDFDSQASLMGL